MNTKPIILDSTPLAKEKGLEYVYAIMVHRKIPFSFFFFKRYEDSRIHAVYDTREKAEKEVNEFKPVCEFIYGKSVVEVVKLRVRAYGY